MKKNYVFVLLFLVAAGSMAFMNTANYAKQQSAYKNSHLNGSGAPAGRTGAPGESNCTACHSGSPQAGAGINSVIVADGVTPVTSYTPGMTYNVAVSFSTAGAKNGFQIVALNPSNAQAGTISIIPGTGTQLLTGSAGKKYVTHTTAGNTQTSWAFSWTAPATNVGTVTFYLATNQTNSSNTSSGDVIRLSTHEIGSVVGISENSADMGLNVGYNATTGSLAIKYNALSAGESTVNLTDISGKSVFSESIGETSIGENSKSVKLPSDLKAGVYIVHLNVNNRFTSKKIYIQ